jgi:hypothetical protein
VRDALAIPRINVSGLCPYDGLTGDAFLCVLDDYCP